MSRRAKARALFLLAIALLAFCGFATYLSFSYFRSGERWVTHTQEVRAVLGDLEATVSAAGRMRMSYLITGDDSDRNEYPAAAARVRERMRELRALASDNRDQIERCDRFESITNLRLGAWEDSIARRQQGQSVDLPNLLRQNVDFAAQSAAVGAEIRTEETRLLGHRMKAAQHRFLLASTVVLASFFLALILLSLYYRLLNAELHAREQAEETARQAYLREGELRRSEERFRLFVEAVEGYAIFVVDAQGMVSSWNRGAERLKGYTASEILGQHFSRFYPEEDVRCGKPQRQLELASAQGRVEVEGWRVRKDGSRFWANVVITATRDDQGNMIGFTKVTRDFTERMRVQETLQRINAELSAEVAERKSAEKRLAISEQSLRGLSLRLLRAQDEERKRIGRDLHDSLGQYLAALKMKLDLLESALAPSPNGVSQDLAQCVRLTEDAIREIRTISYLLYPPMLEEMGLRGAIPWYLDGFSKRSTIQTTLEIGADLGRLGPEVELTLFRILQESLTNVHRHSGSLTATIRLVVAEGNVVLAIKDTGKGIPAMLLEPLNEERMGCLGVGLRGMHERMRQLGGKLELCSSPQGTTVVASVPAQEPPQTMAKSA
ncbi:MAG TPA: PAS domain S-box protein [Terriglobales bacterium]|nr:PAS domain S-box protein [Terriglobales bacterium]